MHFWEILGFGGLRAWDYVRAWTITKGIGAEGLG